LVIEEQTNQQREASGGAGEGQLDAELDRSVLEADRLLDVGQLQAAFATIKAVIGQKPHHARALRVLGKVFAASGHWEESDSAFRASLDLDPTVAATWMGLGLLCRDQRKTGEARHCFEQAVRLRPNDPFLLSNLAVVLRDSGQIAESIRHFEAALRVHPEAMTAHSNLLLTLHYDPAGTPVRLKHEHQRWAKRHAPSVSAAIQSQKRSPRRSGQGPIRVGFLSGDFRSHPVGRLLSAVWRQWLANEVRIHAYESAGPADELTRELRERADVWRRLEGLSDEAAADQIAADQIDVLIDLSGHTSGHRLGVLHRRPAPVQMTWFGYPNTTGLPSVDYRLTDGEADPPGGEDRYSERLIRLPRVAWVYHPTEPNLPVLPRPSARGERFTWGCLNNPAKVHSGCLEVWGRILSAVPDSRLLLLAREDDEARARIGDVLRSAGARPDQWVFVSPGSSRQFCEYHHRVDVVLDPFPYNGAVTTADALWMGVPVLGICGDSYHSRQGWMIARAMGLEEWSCPSPEALITRAVALAQTPGAIQSLSSSLRPRLQASPLMDHAGFARHLLSVLRESAGSAAGSVPPIYTKGATAS
jgi:predicted O-linked N-acetylglucosamine transferase (SPINDLY family)